MIEHSLFAWYGFSFKHPADWAPVVISGNRTEGYVRLASGGRQGCQVRWRQTKTSGDLQPRLTAYLSKLERDTIRRKEPFRSEVKHESNGLTYRIAAGMQARGAIFFSDACSRVFFVEASGGRADSLLPTFRSLRESFRSTLPEDLAHWSLLGLHVRLPHGLSVTRKLLVAGRTRLEFSLRGVRIEADRWGFAEQLIEKHGLEKWARAALQMPKASVEKEGRGLRLRSMPRLGAPINALVAFDETANQLTCIKAATRLDQWSPRWIWFQQESSEDNVSRSRCSSGDTY